MSDGAQTSLAEQLQLARARGVDALDALRLHYIEALLRRAEQRSGRLRHLLEARALAALTSHQARPDSASDMPPSAGGQSRPGRRALAELLGQLSQAPMEPVQGGNRGQAFDEELQRLELDLIQALSPQLSLTGDVGAGADKASPARELRAARQLKQSRASELAIRLVEHAVQHGPVDPGPLNPHMLAIRALTTMRDLSPSYLARFVTYLESLFWVEHSGGRDLLTDARKGKQG